MLLAILHGDQKLKRTGEEYYNQSVAIFVMANKLSECEICALLFKSTPFFIGVVVFAPKELYVSKVFQYCMQRSYHGIVFLIQL